MKISILIPAYNEEETIGETIESCMRQDLPQDVELEIVVVNDGSKDRTVKVVSQYQLRYTSGFYRYPIRLISLPANRGKAVALNAGVENCRGEIVVTVDADSTLDRNFIRTILPRFKDPKIACVAGMVVSKERNILTACREIEYLIGQEIHKRGQSVLNSIFVAPGVCSAYRKRLMHFRSRTVSEDLDLTWRLRKKDYKIAFEPRAKGYTRDPPNLKAYVRQIRRWYSGGWENLKRHKPFFRHGFFGWVEVPILYLEGVIFGLLYTLFLPLLLFFPMWMLFIILFDFTILLLASLYGILALKRYSLILAIPSYYVLRVLNEVVFLFTGVTQLSGRPDLRWHFAREKER
jgi:cellulose synthase/poly-beta-1,6-N-acetylglucosamine synthase-like glycosyltransferase